MPFVDFHVAAAWHDRCAAALAGYADSLVREVASRVLRPRNTWTAAEICERLLTAYSDPVFVDRVLQTLTPPARKLLRLIGISRQPQWRIRGLLDLLGAIGHEDGLSAVQELLNAGLIFPAATHASPMASFDTWLKQLAVQHLSVFALPLAATRARNEDLTLPEMVVERHATVPIHEADGLEWPLRLSVLWQVVKAAPLRRTQHGGFFKRDLDRLRTQPLLTVDSAEGVVKVADLDLLVLLLGLEDEVLVLSGDQLVANTLPESWSKGIHAADVGLWAALPGLTNWCPVTGWSDDPNASRWMAPLAVLSLAFLAAAPADAWIRTEQLNSWAQQMTEAPPGACEALLLGLLHQLRLVHAAKHRSHWLVRLSPFGRTIAESAKSLPPDRPAAEQTLLVQPNLEIVLFRQGLTPSMVARLARVAVWKTLGLACTLELNADSVYHGLEAGETLNDLVTFLERHGTRALSETVLATLRSWASKRERVLVYANAILLEFRTSGDLDRALRQGLIERRITDRIGLIAGEDRIDYGQFRLVGTRDYLAPDEQCASIEGDGLTLAVNENRSDLLLDSEVRRFAEPSPDSNGEEGLRYVLTPQTLLTARRQGIDARELDAWYRRRTGQPIPPAARLLLTGDATPPLTLEKLTILRTPTAEVADGLVHWPETRAFVVERLSETVLSIQSDAVTRLRAKLAEVGVRID